MMSSSDWQYAEVRLAASARVGSYCVIGSPKEARLSGEWPDPPEIPPVVIGDRCILFHHVVIYEGVQLGDDCVIEDHARIGYNTVVGARTRVIYGGYLCDRVSIGADCRIAGFVCDGSVIGDRCTVMGELVHEYTHPHQGWWQTDEEPPSILDDSVIGYGSRVVGGVTIGPRAYVAAGAVVTRDVPPETVVTGVNVMTPASDWRGDRLQDLIKHWQRGK